MSLSLVYQDLQMQTPMPDPAWRKRGEDLCRESLSLAESRHKATAWYNLGNRRRLGEDFEEAAGAFLEAANIYEQLKDELMLGYSLAFRADCLLVRKNFVGARLEALRAVEFLVKQPDASKPVILLAYNVGEKAWWHLTGKMPQ